MNPSAAIFYKVQFTITEKDPMEDLLWTIVRHIRRWQTQKWSWSGIKFPNEAQEWGGFKTGGAVSSLDERHTVRMLSEVCFSGENGVEPYWACRIIENYQPEEKCAPRQWITDIGYEPIEKGKAFFSCMILYIDRAGFIGECQPTPAPNVPRLIRLILQDQNLQCRRGMDDVLLSPIRLTPGGWENLWKNLRNREREIPYIYISPVCSENEEPKPLIDPNKLSEAVGGNALVFYSTDVDAETEMAYYCPMDFRCFGGAVRLYLPGLLAGDSLDSLRHRFLSARTLEELGEETVLEIFHRALAQDTTGNDRLFRLEDCRERRNAVIRQKRLSDLKNQHSKELDDVFEMTLLEEEKRLQAEEQAEAYKYDLDALQCENRRLQQENETYRLALQKKDDTNCAYESRSRISAYPKTPTSIADYFTGMFADRIAFSDDGIKSLKACTIPADWLWEALYGLATTMYDLYREGTGDIFKEFYIRTGLDAGRGEGSMTRKDAKLMRQFTTIYQGIPVDVEAHITFAKISQSIHFGFSAQHHKLIVGSCGEHKTIYSTQKHK